MSEPNTGWQLLLETARDNIRNFEKGLEDAEIGLECLQATIPVYEKRQKKHPSNYGAGRSLESAKRDIEYNHIWLQRWQECERLILMAMDDRKPIEPPISAIESFWLTGKRVQ